MFPSGLNGRLSVLAEKMPRQAVACLRLTVQRDKEGWAIRGWRAEARAIVATAIQSNHAEARHATVDLVQRLRARSHLEFRSLLP